MMASWGGPKGEGRAVGAGWRDGNERREGGLVRVRGLWWAAACEGCGKRGGRKEEARDVGRWGGPGGRVV